MRHRFRTTVPAVLLVLAIGGGVLSGCSSDPEAPDDDASTAADPTPTPPETGEEPVDPGTDPNSPFVVAASTVAARSVDQVTQLHAMGVATTGQSEDFPTEQIPMLAQAITGSLSELIRSATLMTPPKQSAAADLVTALEAYRTLSRELRSWGPEGDALPTSWFDSLRSTDVDWKAALEALGGLSGDNLLADLPPLLMPEPA